MTTIILSILLIVATVISFAIHSSKNISRFKGFSNTALKRALNGELSRQTVMEMIESIRVSDEAKRKAMKPNGPSLIPLNS